MGARILSEPGQGRGGGSGWSGGAVAPGIKNPAPTPIP
jgi:hypothetical protein